MDAAETLLRAIESAMDDDAPRLVYADWLAERGDPRGECIRVQCRIAQVDRAAGDGDGDGDDASTWTAARRALKIQEGRLLRAHGEAWGAGLAALGVMKHEFARGFVDSVSCGL